MSKARYAKCKDARGRACYFVKQSCPGQPWYITKYIKSVDRRGPSPDQTWGATNGEDLILEGDWIEVDEYDKPLEHKTDVLRTHRSAYGLAVNHADHSAAIAAKDAEIKALTTALAEAQQKLQVREAEIGIAGSPPPYPTWMQKVEELEKDRDYWKSRYSEENRERIRFEDVEAMLDKFCVPKTFKLAHSDIPLKPYQRIQELGMRAVTAEKKLNE